MSSSYRKRKSLWDMKEDIQPSAEISENNEWNGNEIHTSLHGGHHPRFPDVYANDALQPKDSGWPSCEPLPGNRSAQKDDSMNKDRNEIPEKTRVSGGDDSFSKSMSPVFDRWGPQHRSRSPENRWSQLDRDRGRSRSRSRSRSRGRVRDWSRSWSRSQSRSPLRDRRRESYGWSDRRSGSGVSSQPCRDFPMGKCRRGSQCRFLHQDNINYRGGGHMENGSAERWRSRPEFRGISKYGNSKGPEDCPQGNVPDEHGNVYGEHEPQRNSSRAKSCLDFLKGKCHRGASCRYSHHDPGDNYERVSRNTSFDHERRYPPNRSGKVPCKFFAIGKCNRYDDCRFSHDGSTSGNLEERLRDERWGHNSDDMKKSWNGPTWDDATCVSNLAKSTGWGGSSAGDMNFSDPATAEKQNADRWGHTSGNESKMWGGSAWKEKAALSYEYINPHQGSGSNGANVGTTEFMGMEKVIHREEPQLIPQSPQSQALDVHVHDVYETTRMQGASGHQLGVTTMQPEVPENFDIQQHLGQTGGDIAIIDGCNALCEVKVSGNSMHPVLVPGQSFSQNVNCMVSLSPASFSGTDQSQNILFQNPPNGHSVDLKGIIQHIFSPLNPQNQTQINHEEAGKTQRTMEFEVPLVTSEVHQNVMTSEQVAQIANLSASLTQRFENRQLPQSQAVSEPSETTGMVFSLSDSACPVPPIAAMDDPVTRSHEQYDFMDDGMVPSKPDNCNLPPGSLSISIEHRNHLPLERSSLLPVVDPESSKLHQNGDSEKEYHESPKLKQQESHANPEVKENNITVAEKCKEEQENIYSENVDADHKVQESSSSKDEKAMRLLKVALVEFVKEILKPTWKEGKMSREVHKTIVKKVVDKVTSSIPGVHIPKTQDKIEHYLSSSEPKITKLVQAYVERFLKS